MTSYEVEANGPESREYQLRTRDPGDYLFVARWMLVAVLVILLIFVAVVVFDALGNRPNGGFLNPKVWVTLSILGAGIAILILGILQAGPGALKCTWTDRGFVLRYRSGRERSFEWDAPRFRLRILKYLDSNGLVTYEINQGIPAHTPISEELYLAILREAQRRGLETRTQVSKLLSGQVVSHDISHRPVPRATP